MFGKSDKKRKIMDRKSDGELGQILIETLYLLTVVGGLLLCIGFFVKSSEKIIKKYQFKEYKYERKI